ncbi:MAG: AsmA family protein, partial [Kofleriaceae bacterium]|nr:AsmA family protein [Kofleriaceae bacterium]
MSPLNWRGVLKDEAQPAAPTTPRPRWRKWTRRIVKGFGGLLLLFAVAIAALLVLLHTDYGRNLVRERLEKELSAVFVGEVRVGGVHGSLLSEFSLSDISIEDAQGEVAITIGLVTVDYSISQLVHKTIMIDSLLLDEVYVNGVRDSDGTINLAQLIQQSDDDSPLPWRVSVPKIAVRNSSASFRDGLRNSGIQEFSLDASLTFDEGILRAELTTLKALVVPPSLKVDGPAANGVPFSLRGILEMGLETVAVQSLEAKLGDAIVSLPTLLLQDDGHTNADAKVILPASMVRLFDPTTPLLADV